MGSYFGFWKKISNDFSHISKYKPSKIMQKLLINSYKDLPKFHKFNFFIIHPLNGSYSKFLAD